MTQSFSALQKSNTYKTSKKALILFHLVSGFQVNFHKSSLIGINVSEAWLNRAAEVMLCKVGNLPFTYLGLPIGSNISRINSWEPIIDRMKKNWMLGKEGYSRSEGESHS